MAQHAIRWSLRICLAGIFNVHAKSKKNSGRTETKVAVLIIAFLHGKTLKY
jgi:hypothetical protein